MDAHGWVLVHMQDRGSRGGVLLLESASCDRDAVPRAALGCTPGWPVRVVLHLPTQLASNEKRTRVDNHHLSLSLSLAVSPLSLSLSQRKDSSLTTALNRTGGTKTYVAAGTRGRALPHVTLNGNIIAPSSSSIPSLSAISLRRGGSSPLCSLSSRGRARSSPSASASRDVMKGEFSFRWAVSGLLAGCGRPHDH